MQWPWGRAFSGRGARVRVRVLEVGQGEVVSIRLSQEEEGCEVMEGPVRVGLLSSVPCRRPLCPPGPRSVGHPPPRRIHRRELLVFIRTAGLACPALYLPLDPCGRENRRGSSVCHLGRLAALRPVPGTSSP